MDDFQSAVAAGAKLALCSTLGAYGGSAPKLAAVAVGTPTPATIAAAVGAGLSLYAFANNCTWDPNGTGPAPGPGPIQGCQEAANGSCLAIDYWNADGADWVGAVACASAIVGTGTEGTGDNKSWWFEWRSYDGSTVSRVPVPYYPDGSNAVRGRVVDGPNGEPAACKTPAPDGPAPRPDPVPYTDPASGCEINVTLLGWTLGPANTVGGTYLIEPAPAPAARSTGGVIGGCNFAPVVYVDRDTTGGGGGGGGGDGPIVPVPPDWPGPSGDDWWKALAQEVVDGIYEWAVGRALDSFFSPTYAAGSRTLIAACDYKEDGTPEEFIVTWPEQKFDQALFTALDTIMDFQQQILKWKTPVCSGNHVSGTPYTINWVSDERNNHGNSLRKEFRYFDQSGKDLGEHFLHWKDFTWQAGPIFVGTSGTPLGKTHVWAETEAEGRRVIEHAAAIADVTLPDDSWGISVARGGRVGQPGTMRLQRSDGRWWISTRNGPSGPPRYPAA
jgi:hypothetical protein